MCVCAQARVQVYFYNRWWWLFTFCVCVCVFPSLFGLILCCIFVICYIWSSHAAKPQNEFWMENITERAGKRVCGDFLIVRKMRTTAYRRSTHYSLTHSLTCVYTSKFAAIASYTHRPWAIERKSRSPSQSMWSCVCIRVCVSVCEGDDDNNDNDSDVRESD